MAQNELVDFAGLSATIGAVGLKTLAFFNLAEINEIIITITAFGGIVWLFFKIKISYYEYKQKKKDYENDKGKTSK